MQLTLPSRVTCAKLFGVGPLVDSLHNAVEELIASTLTKNEDAVAPPRSAAFDISPPLDYVAARLQAAKTVAAQNLKSKATLESIRQLRREYLYGLHHVAELTDLGQAPDALLYGNFPQELQEKPEDNK